MILHGDGVFSNDQDEVNIGAVVQYACIFVECGALDTDRQETMKTQEEDSHLKPRSA